MITVRLPSTLQSGCGAQVTIDEPVATVADLLQAIDVRCPGLRAQLEDHVFNVAVNDEMLLHGAGQRALNDGDVVEIVPAIAGG
jgi:molybdopterin converting factor small subunit